jgi:hypothetical protein
MDTTTLFLFLVFFVLGYVVREFLGGSKKEKPEAGDNVMRFWIDEQKVQHVELEGEEVSVTDASPEQRKRMADLLKVLQKWVQYSEPAQPAPVAATATTVAAVMPALDAGEPPLVGPDLPKEATKPRLDLAKGAQMFFSENVSRKVEPKPKTIVGMIDDVLQKKLVSSPLQSKKIKLEDGLHGEVIVVVDGERYEGVDQVPDPQIQSLIREAIAEWDKSNT